MGPEALLERRVSISVKDNAGMCIKMTGHPGLPDRLIILPGPRFVFVEMKAATGRISPIQEHMIERLRALGCDVRVVKGLKETETFIKEVMSDE